MSTTSGHLMAQALVFTLLCGTALQGVASARSLLQETVPKTQVLVYYLHESYATANATVVVVGGQNNNLTFQGFGQTIAVDDPIKEGGEQNSTVIGFASAFGTTSNHPGISHLSTAHTLNSTTLGVGRLELLANIDLNQPLKPSEAVIAAGTGDFSYYQGVATIEVVYYGAPFITFKVTATLVRY